MQSHTPLLLLIDEALSSFVVEGDDCRAKADRVLR